MTKILYDDAMISYRNLPEIFCIIHVSTTSNRLGAWTSTANTAPYSKEDDENCILEEAARKVSQEFDRKNVAKIEPP